VITPEEYEDLPEMTDEMFARTVLKKAGRPKSRRSETPRAAYPMSRRTRTPAVITVPRAAVVDISALVAIITGEPGAERLVDALQLVLARDGARRFGKGRHAAALNLGDLYAHALATDRALPLLFVGHDVPLTDVERLVG